MLWKRIKLYLHFLKSMAKVNYGLLVGMWKLTALPQPTITIFGGTKLSPDSEHIKKIKKLTKLLVKDGFSILTGGGAGVMEAANLEAYEIANKKYTQEQLHLAKNKDRNMNRRLISMGIGVENLQKNNTYLQKSIILPYFFTRKWLLVRYAVGFIVGPGGFGTLDELAEVITLIQTHKMPKTPLVLFGVEYWQPFVDWVYKRALRDNLLTEEDTKIIYITDSVEDAYNYITSMCIGFRECGISAKSVE